MGKTKDPYKKQIACPYGSKVALCPLLGCRRGHGSLWPFLVGCGDIGRCWSSPSPWQGHWISLLIIWRRLYGTAVYHLVFNVIYNLNVLRMIF